MDLQGFTTIDEVGGDDDNHKEVSINLAIQKNFPSTAAEEIDYLNRLLSDIERNSDCNNISSNGISHCKDKAELLIQSGVKLVLNKFNSLGLEKVTKFNNNNMDKVDIAKRVESSGKIDDSNFTLSSINTNLVQIESTSESEKLSLVHEGLVSDGNVICNEDKSKDFIKTSAQSCCVIRNDSILNGDSLRRIHCNYESYQESNVESEFCDKDNSLSNSLNSNNENVLKTTINDDSKSSNDSCENSSENPKNKVGSNKDHPFQQNSNIDQLNKPIENVRNSMESNLEAINETEKACQNVLSSHLSINTIPEKFSDLSTDYKSIDDSDGNYINISLPLKILSIKAEPQEMEEEFDFGDFLHDPAEEFNLDDVKEEQGGEAEVMETFSINVETKPEPCEEIKQEYAQSCYIPHIHYLVKENEKYSKEQVTAALLMSQSSLAKVIDMEMFSNLGQTFPITSLYKLEYLVDDLQILPFRDKDLIDNFFQTCGCNFRKWAKIFKIKRKYKKQKENIMPVVIDKTTNNSDKMDEIYMENKKVDVKICDSKKKDIEKNSEKCIRPIIYKQPVWTESDILYKEITKKRYEGVFNRTVNSTDLSTDNDGLTHFNGFVKDYESQTQVILEKLMSKLKCLQLELDKIKVVSHYSDRNTEREIIGEIENIFNIKKGSMHKKVKDNKHESIHKKRDSNKELKHIKKYDGEIKINSDDDEHKHKKEIGRDFSIKCENDSAHKVMETNLHKQSSAKLVEKHLHKSKSIERNVFKSSKTMLETNVNKLDKKKNLKYEKKLFTKYKLKKCSVTISSDAKVDSVTNLFKTPMPVSEQHVLLKQYVHSFDSVNLQKTMHNNTKRLNLCMKSPEMDDSINSDSSEMSDMGLNTKSLETNVLKNDSGSNLNKNISMLDEVHGFKVDHNNGHQLDSTCSADSLDDSMDKSFENTCLFSDTSSISINEDLCNQLKEIDNILKDAGPMLKSHSPNNDGVSILHNSPNLGSQSSINNEADNNPVSLDDFHLTSVKVYDKDFKDNDAKDSHPGKFEKENSCKLVDQNLCIDENDVKDSHQNNLSGEENLCKLSIQNLCNDVNDAKDSLQNDLSSKENCNLSIQTLCSDKNDAKDFYPKDIFEKEKLNKFDENKLVQDCFEKLILDKPSSNDCFEISEDVIKNGHEEMTKIYSQKFSEDRKSSAELYSDISNQITNNKLTEHVNLSTGRKKKLFRNCHVSLEDIGKSKLYRKIIKKEKKWLFKHSKLPLPRKDTDKVGPLSSKPVMVKKDAFEDILSKAMDKTMAPESLKRKKPNSFIEKEQIQTNDQLNLIKNKKKQKSYLDDVRLKIFREGFGKRSNADVDTRVKMDSSNTTEELPIFGAAFRIPKKVISNNDQEKQEPLSLLQRKERKSASYYDNDVKYPQNHYGRGLQNVNKREFGKISSVQENILDKSSPGRNDLKMSYSKQDPSKPFVEKSTNLHRSNNNNLRNQYSDTSLNMEQIVEKDSVKDNRAATAIPSISTSYLANQFSAQTHLLNLNTNKSTIYNEGNKISVVINSNRNSKYEKPQQSAEYFYAERKRSGPYTPEYDRPPSVDNDHYDNVNDGGIDIHSSDSPCDSPSEKTTGEAFKNASFKPSWSNSPQLEEIKCIPSMKNYLKPNNSPVSKEIVSKALVKPSYSPMIEDGVKGSVRSRLKPRYSPPHKEEVTNAASGNHINMKLLPDLHLQTNKIEINIPNNSQINIEKENKSVTPNNVSISDRESQRKVELLRKLDSLDKKGQIRLYEKYKSLYNTAKKDFYDDATDMNKNSAKQKKFKTLHYFRKFYYDLKIYLCEQKKSSHEKKIVAKPELSDSKDFNSVEKIPVIASHKISLNPIEDVPSSPTEKTSVSPKDSEPYSPSGSPVLKSKIKPKKPSPVVSNEGLHKVSPCIPQDVNLSQATLVSADYEESESKIKDIINSFFTDQEKGKNITSSILGLSDKSDDIIKNLSAKQVLLNNDSDNVNAPYSPSGSPVIAKTIASSFADATNAFSEYLNIDTKKSDIDGEGLCSKSKSISNLSLDIRSKSKVANDVNSFKSCTLLNEDIPIPQSSILNSATINTDEFEPQSNESKDNFPIIFGTSLTNTVNTLNTKNDKVYSLEKLGTLNFANRISLDHKLNKSLHLLHNVEPHNDDGKTIYEKQLEDAYDAFSAAIDSINTGDEGVSTAVDSPLYSAPGSPLLVENVCSSFLSYVPPETKEALIATKLELAKEASTICSIENNSDTLSQTSESSIQDVVMDDAEVVMEDIIPKYNKIFDNSEVCGTEVAQNIIDPLEIVNIRNDNSDKPGIALQGQFVINSNFVQLPVGISSSYSDNSALSNQEPTFNSSFNSLPLLSVPILPNVNIPPPQFLPNFGTQSISKPSGILGVVVEDVEPSDTGTNLALNDQAYINLNEIDLSLASSLLLTPPPPPLTSPPALNSSSEITKNDETSASLQESNANSQSEKKSSFSELISEFFQKWEEPSESQEKQQSDFEVVYSKIKEKASKPSQDAWVYYSEPPLAQGLIDKVEKIPLVGLQYILEVQKEPNPVVETCNYICSLCSKKMSTATLLAHVKSVPHRLKYTECHSKDVHQKYGKLEVKQWTATLVKEFTAALENLEKNTGRQSMAIVKESKMNSGVNFLKNKVQTALKDIESGSNESEKGSSSSLTNGSQGVSSNNKSKASAIVVDIAKSPEDRFKRPGESPRIRPRSSDRYDKGKDKASPRTPNSGHYSRDRDGKLKDGDRLRENDRSKDSVRSRDGNRSRDRDRRGDSYKKDKRHSSDRKILPAYGSQSNASSYKRSRSRSPLRRGRRSQERSGSLSAEERRIKDFRVEESRLKAQHDKEMDRYTSDPESHPRYKAEWGKFWETRSREIEQQGRDPRYYDFKLDWIPYWKKRMAELCDLELQAQRKEYLLRYRIEDPDKNKKPSNSTSSVRTNIKNDSWVDPSIPYNRPNSGQFAINRQSNKGDLIQQNQQSLSPWERSHGFDKPLKNLAGGLKSSYEIDFSVVGTLKLLTDLEDQLGSLVPAAKTLLKKAIDTTENGGRPIELFRDNDNLVLLMLSNVKLNSQINSGILDDMSAARTQMAIESTNWLLKEAEKLYIGSNDKNPSHMLGLDLKLIATATIGMDTVQVAMYIAQQLLNIGKSDASETDLQQILSAVSAHHLQFKSVTETSQPPINQQIGDPHSDYINYSEQNYPHSNNSFSYPVKTSINMHGQSVNQSNFQNLSVLSSSVPALFPAGAQTADAATGKESATEVQATSKSGLTMLQTAYEDNSNTDMDKLSLKDLQELLSNFRNLSSDKQQALTDYLKKLEATDSKKVTKLRAMMHYSNKPSQPPPQPPSQPPSQSTSKPETDEKVMESWSKEQLRYPSQNKNNEHTFSLMPNSEFVPQSFEMPITEHKEFDTRTQGNLYYGDQRESADYFQSNTGYDYKTSSGNANDFTSFASNIPPRDMPNEREDYSRPEPNRNYSSIPDHTHYQDFARKPDSAATSSFREFSSNSNQFSDSSLGFNKEMAGNSFSKPKVPPTDLYPPRNFGRPTPSSSFISESFRNFDSGLSLDRPTTSFRNDYSSGFPQNPESSYGDRDFVGESNQNFENNARQPLLSSLPNQANRFPNSNFPEHGGLYPARGGFRGPRFNN